MAKKKVALQRGKGKKSVKKDDQNKQMKKMKKMHKEME